ncbi:lipid A export permease/ATP-binding protein MsbA [Wenzhouxiangella sp. XN79A]|uniref:lipid A export permease/ATP-binding protein MsbA n=1 Tax=Wenzhouxiangella sp. XN79A TaxID=2724193 RepID=UPI00144ACE3E|nr:lipid A export permease/ATP-binding protein MsbA [Wenzhouxiangella sp. XN79A]
MSEQPAAATIYRRLLGFLRGHPWVVAGSLLAVSLDAAGQAMFVYLLRPLIDDTLGASGPAFSPVLPALVLVAVVIRVSGNFGGVFGMEWLGRRLIADLRRDLFGRYLDLPIHAFDREGSGSMISRLTYNTEQVAQAATTALIGTVRDLLTVVGLLTVMLIQSWRLTLTMLLLVPVIAFVVFVVSRRFRTIARRIQDSMGAVTHRTEQAVHGQEIIRVFGGQGREAGDFERINESNRRLHLRLRATQLVSSSMIQLAAGVSVVVLLLVAGSPFMRADVSAGIFMSVLAAMVATIPPLKRLTNMHVLIQKGIAAADSIYDVLDREPEPRGGSHAPERVRGEVVFDQVTFRYPDHRPRVLEDIDLVLEPGTVTALVGRSGSGKTTLARLLPRFHAPVAGRILIDGVDLVDFDLEALRRQIALVGQQTVLFDDTVAANIRYGQRDDVDRAAIERAARQAHATEFIDALPDGLDTRLGAGGVQLSGGQKQRIAIARALLKNAPILILDEATSALDAESEQAVQRGLDQLMANRTTLVIAHRLTTVERADQVVVMDRGRIVEQGRHADLLARDDGVYQSLYHAQFRHADPV